MEIELPEILNIPPKMLPMVTEFNNYKYFLADGGRGSSKTQSVARFLLYLGEQKKLRIVCGREQQNNIEESVFSVLRDLVNENNLNYDIRTSQGRERLIHNQSGTEIKFKGFREQGAVNVKGLEGVDILWIDECQAIQEYTLSVIIPTLRKEKAKFFFTMNRYMRDDAVYEFCQGRKDCLSIKINYFENPFCPQTLKIEAQNCRDKSEREYRHVWLGEPIAAGDEYLFNYDNLHSALEVEPFGDIYKHQRVIGIDFAAQGNDLCVATVLDRLSDMHWQVSEQIAWDEPEAAVSVGKIITIIGQYKPDVTILDVGGMGTVVHSLLTEANLSVIRFDGASTKEVIPDFLNMRADGYYMLRDWIDNKTLKIYNKDKEIIKELEKIKIKFLSNGKRAIQSKVDMKKELRYSPDRADSVMMAVYGTRWLGRTEAYESYNTKAVITRVNKKSRRFV